MGMPIRLASLDIAEPRARFLNCRGQGDAGPRCDTHVKRQQPAIERCHGLGLAVGSEVPPVSKGVEKGGEGTARLVVKGEGRRIFRREPVVRAIEEPHQHLRSRLQRMPSQNARHGSSQYLIAAGQDQDVGPRAKLPQGARQLATRPVHPDLKFPGATIVATVDGAGEGRGIVQGTHDVRGGRNRTEAGCVDPHPGKFDLKPVDRSVVMTAKGMDGRIDDERLHRQPCSLRQAGRKRSTVSRIRITARHLKSNSTAL